MTLRGPRRTIHVPRWRSTVATVQRLGRTSPKQELTVRQFSEDHPTVARAMGTGKAGKLSVHLKAARLVVCQRSPQGR